MNVNGNKFTNKVCHLFTALFVKEQSQSIKSLMKQKIKRMMDKNAEYSGMIKSIIEMKGLTIG